jgi:3-dehydroquinate synthetase
VYVSAVDPRGMPATGEAPTTLIATLKAAMGGK